MLTVQYIALATILGLMIYVLSKYGRKELEWRDFMFWEILLVIMLIITLKPVEISLEVKRILGLGRGLDALFVVAIGIGYLMIFRVYLAVDRAEREITELTRKLAIELGEINEKLEKIKEKANSCHKTHLQKFFQKHLDSLFRKSELPYFYHSLFLSLFK